VGLHRVEGQRRDGTTLPLSLAVSEVHVGGYLVYTAIVRELAAGELPDHLTSMPGAGEIRTAVGVTGTDQRSVAGAPGE
jgi:hypothetical protein